MEIDDEATTHEQRMEEYARQAAKAGETLTAYAMWWTLAAALGAFIWILIAIKG